MIGYIYIINHKQKNKIYIGQKKGPPEDSKSYLGSGKKITRAVEKYGEKEFDKKIICVVEAHDSVFRKRIDSLERFFIKEYNATDRNSGYNIATGGVGGNASGDRHYMYGKKMPIETSKKISEKKTGSKRDLRSRQKQSQSFNERIKLVGHHKKKGMQPPDGWVEKMIACNTGSKRSQETKEKIRLNKIKFYTEKNGIVSTPFGIFESQTSAADYIGVSKQTIKNRIESKSEKFENYKFL